ncbi:MAG: histone deacetylase [Acidimicrobiales bacterium]|nr:histone deacetylase [Acidimicrobiales bacterium]
MESRVLFGSIEGVDRHDTGYGHPERHERLVAIEAAVAPFELTRVVARAATDTELTRVHDLAYVEALTTFAAEGGGHLDPDTPVSPGSADTARLAAGLGLAAIEALDAGVGTAAFVAPRPPGHHAFDVRGSGFCLFNNVALAAALLAERGERVAIFDWDVHHGNGTQAIFWDDPRVLYASTHQYPAYPGTGAADERGGPNAEGLTVNVPLRPGTDGVGALSAFDAVIGPAIESFAPTWILVSAGYDAHRADPLADLRWDVADYAALTRRVMEFDTPVLAFLEGGYDLDALAASSAATIATLRDG